MKDRGWRPITVGAWVVVASTRTNRRRIGAHATFLGNAFPADRHRVRQWLHEPHWPIAALSPETFGGHEQVTMPRRVRRKGVTEERAAA